MAVSQKAGWFAVQLAIAAQPSDMSTNVAASFRRTSTGRPASASGAIQSATCVQGGGPPKRIRTSGPRQRWYGRREQGESSFLLSAPEGESTAQPRELRHRL